MFRNYLKIIFRNLLREPLYAGINIAGLSMGAAVAILIFLFVRHEWSYDHFHADAGRIYRAWVKEQYGGGELFNTNTPFILGRELKSNFPEVEELVQYYTTNNLIRKGTLVEQEGVHIATPSFLTLFDFPLLAGDAGQALDQPNKVVLTEALARKYFGEPSPIGQTLDIQLGSEWRQFQVSGVAAAPPANSSIQFEMILPWELTRELVSERGLNSWTMVAPENYVRLAEGVDPAAFEAKLAPFIDRQVAGDYQPGEYQVGLQPLTDIHLNNDYPTGLAQVSDWRYPYILGAIALLILLLAAINYITMAVGRSVARAKEVGVRKVSGATRGQLMRQFWSEALVVSVLAVGIGLLIAELGLPGFNRLLDQSLSIDYSVPFITALLGLAGVLALLAGGYPALVLSRFSPIRALRGTVGKLGQDKHLILRGLVGIQFVLSVGLIICTVVMQQQLRYLQAKNLGFDEAYLLTLPYTEQPSNERGMMDIYQEGLQRAELLRNELADDESVLAVTASSHTLGVPGWARVGYIDPATDKLRWNRLLACDERFLPLMGIDLVAGRNFSSAVGTDAAAALIVNQTMARDYGWEGYIDQPLPPPFNEFRLIGIVKDFHFTSLHSEVEPLAITMNLRGVLSVMSDMTFGESPNPKMTIKLAGGDIPAAIQAVETAWKNISPEQPFNFAFVDEALDAQYRSEQRLSRGLSVATLLAIFIAALGLFGIATLTTARRTKEIGVRKVMGATTWNIVLLLNRSITGLVLIATLIAAPLAWLLMRQWLSDFAYRVGISPLILLGAGLLALLIAWMAVSYQSLRAARTNPVEALRYE